jgi:hypothetical protein
MRRELATDARSDGAARSRTARRHPGACACEPAHRARLHGSADPGSPMLVLSTHGPRERPPAIPTAAHGSTRPVAPKPVWGSVAARRALVLSFREPGYFPILEDRVDRKPPMLESQARWLDISSIQWFQYGERPAELHVRRHASGPIAGYRDDHGRDSSDKHKTSKSSQRPRGEDDWEARYAQ